MARVIGFIMWVSKALSGVAAFALAAMMCLTVADVIGRAGGYPILGTYELVSIICLVAIAFAIPLTSFKRRHVYMEFLIDRMGVAARKWMHTGTRLLCFGLFVLAGTDLFHMGAEFASAREVTMALRVPFYPFAYGAGVCCFIQSLVCLCDIVKIWEGTYE